MLALFSATAALCTELVEMQRNTLANNGHWASTKMSLQRPVPGATEYVSTRPALARNRLDLSPYQGFQEVIYRGPLHLRQLAGRFSLDDRANLSIIFDRDEHGFAGVLLSRNSRVAASYFEATAEGRFLRRVPLAQSSAGWHRFRVILDGNQARLLLDGAALLTQTRRAAGGDFGFRGGTDLGHAYVDDLEIDADEGHFSESFRNSAGYFIVLAGAAGLLGALIALGALAARRRRWPFAVATLTICLFIDVCAVSFGLIDYYSLSARYPAIHRQDQDWHALARKRIDKMRATLRGYPPRTSQSRILVIGASQAWGCGARTPSETWTALLQARFEREQPKRPVEVIAASVVFAHVSGFRELYENEGLALDPRVLVVYPSNHEPDPGRLRENLVRLAQLSRERGVATLFVLGAHEPDSAAESDPPDLVMREVAAQFGIEVIDLHPYLAERRERGFLYWDSQHLTPYGQELIAELLYPALDRLVDSTRQIR